MASSSSRLPFHLVLYRVRYGRSSALALLRNPNLARTHPWAGLAVRHEPGRGGRKAFSTHLCGGICSGYLADSVLAALGLAALLQSSDVVFEIVRYAGAAYLFYLGVGMILGKGVGLEAGEHTDVGEVGEPSGAVFRQGFLTAVLNPKGLLLFLSLLPHSSRQVPRSP
jgi:arginine exporter protein ArgO